jgi:hypothetical protein
LRVETVYWLLGLSRESFESKYWIFGGMAALLLMWPRLSDYWERFFVGKGRLYEWWDKGRWCAALLLWTLTMLAWWGGLSKLKQKYSCDHPQDVEFLVFDVSRPWPFR